jgi:uncharacterized protein (DUF433 family)
VGVISSSGSRPSRSGGKPTLEPQRVQLGHETYLILPKLTLTRQFMVETVRRYSKQPHLWRTSKRLAKLLDRDQDADPVTRPAASPTPHVHKLAQRIDTETIAALREAYQAGASLADLQEQYSLGRGSVQQLLREAGVRRRRQSLTDAEVAVLVERYKAGLTIREIAAEQELPKTTVQDALRRTEIGMRQAVRRKPPTQ